MKLNKIYSIFITSLFVSSLFYISKQHSDIDALSNKNKEISESSKELKKIIDIQKENIVSLKQELENNKGFKNTVYFDPNDITVLSEASYEQLSYVLKDTKLSKYIDSFLTVEKTHNINALAMIGIVANESAWLTSNRTLRQNNVTGYAVYSNDSKGTTFSSIEECIVKTGELLKEDYINKNGKHYKGLSISDINIMYSSDEEWDNTVSSIGYQLRDKINEIVELIYS